MPTYSLVFSPKWYLVDKNGEPAAGGRLFTYLSTNKAVKKPFYKDAAGIAEWPNPIVFDDANATQGEFYGEDGTAYYLEAYDQNGELLWTVDNYLPPAAAGGSPTLNYNDNVNFFLNSDYRFNYYPETQKDLSAITDPVLIADGGWYFKKNNDSGGDSIIFNEFTPGQAGVSNNPKYYLRYQCTSSGSGEEKYIYFRFKDVRAFSGSANFISIGFDARSSTTSSIAIYYRQHFGTGGSSDVGPTQLASETLTSDWDRYEENSLQIPSVSGKSISDDGDDYLEIQIRFEPDAISVIDLTKFQFELAQSLTNYEYESPELNNYRTRGSNLPRIIPGNNIGQTDYLVPEAKPDGTMLYLGGSNPVGTILMYGASTLPSGYLWCNGATHTCVGNNAIYTRLYNAIGNTWGYGENAHFFPIENDGATSFCYSTVGGTTTSPSTGTAGAAGLTITAFQGAQSPMSNVEVYQNVLGNGFNFLYFQNSSFGVTAASTAQAGTQITISQDIVGATYIRGYSVFQTSSASTMTESSYFTFSTPSVNYYVWFRIDSTGVDPSVPGHTGIQVDLFNGDSNIDVARKIRHACYGRQGLSIEYPAASALSGGEYFDIYNRTQAARVWFRKDGSGSQPSISSEIPVVVDIMSGDTNIEVATKAKSAIEAMQFKVPDLRGTFPRFWNQSLSPALDPDSTHRIGYDGLDFSSGDNIGTFQLQSTQSHNHDISSSLTSSFLIPDQTKPPLATDASSPLGDSLRYANLASLLSLSVTAQNYGLYETRPINAYVGAIIKY